MCINYFGLQIHPTTPHLQAWRELYLESLLNSSVLNTEKTIATSNNKVKDLIIWRISEEAKLPVNKIFYSNKDVHRFSDRNTVTILHMRKNRNSNLTEEYSLPSFSSEGRSTSSFLSPNWGSWEGMTESFEDRQITQKQHQLMQTLLGHKVFPCNCNNPTFVASRKKTGFHRKYFRILTHSNCSFELQQAPNHLLKVKLIYCTAKFKLILLKSSECFMWNCNKLNIYPNDITHSL